MDKCAELNQKNRNYTLQIENLIQRIRCTGDRKTKNPGNSKHSLSTLHFKQAEGKRQYCQDPRADSVVGLSSRRWSLGGDSLCRGQCLRQRVREKYTGFSLLTYWAPDNASYWPNSAGNQLTQEPRKHPAGAGWDEQRKMARDRSEGKQAQNHHTSCAYYANGRTPQISSRHQVTIPRPKSCFLQVKENIS